MCYFLKYKNVPQQMFVQKSMHIHSNWNTYTENGYFSSTIKQNIFTIQGQKGQSSCQE